MMIYGETTGHLVLSGDAPAPSQQHLPPCHQGVHRPTGGWELEPIK